MSEHVLVLTDRELDLLGDLVDNARPETRGVHHDHDSCTLERLRAEVEAVVLMAGPGWIDLARATAAEDA